MAGNPEEWPERVDLYAFDEVLSGLGGFCPACGCWLPGNRDREFWVILSPHRHPGFPAHEKCIGSYATAREAERGPAQPHGRDEGAADPQTDPPRADS